MENIYIAGKITGLDMENVVEKFQSAENRLRECGFNPISPLNNGCRSDSWCEQMVACLTLLLSCSGIYLLSDWQDSDGARIEKVFAEKHGMVIIEQLKS